MKYLYLLFSPVDILPLTDVVLNTEAHAFPRFQMGKLFETGWQRKPRGPDGKIIKEAKTTHAPDDTAKPKDGMETVMVTKTIDTRETGAETSELAKMQTATDAPGAEAAEAQVVLEGTRKPAV